MILILEFDNVTVKTIYSGEESSRTDSSVCYFWREISTYRAFVFWQELPFGLLARPFIVVKNRTVSSVCYFLAGNIHRTLMFWRETSSNKTTCYSGKGSLLFLAGNVYHTQPCLRWQMPPVRTAFPVMLGMVDYFCYFRRKLLA